MSLNWGNKPGLTLIACKLDRLVGIFGIVVGALLFLHFGTRVTLADDSEDTITYFVSKSDCVVAGTIVGEPLRIVSEPGRVEYFCDFSVVEIYKGDGITTGVTRVVISRSEQDESDLRPIISKGMACVLFLKFDPNRIPKLRTADLWFGIQPSSLILSRYLEGLKTNH